MNDDEEVIHGLHACLAVAEKRLTSVVKVNLTQETVSQFPTLLKHLAKEKRAYKVVPFEELTKIAGTPHHGGISMIAKRRPREALETWGKSLPANALVIGFVGVQNPHNIGAIARSAAHFGASGLLFIDEKAGMISSSTYRVARGALEHLSILSIRGEQLSEAKKLGFNLLAPSPHKGEGLDSYKFKGRTLILLGSEEEGLPSEIEKQADTIITIAGTGEMESLNVSVAAGIIMYSWKRVASK